MIRSSAAVLAALLASTSLSTAAMAQTAASASSGFATSEATDPYIWLEDVEGALWTRALIERCRIGVDEIGKPVRVVIGVDPPATSTGDACGIVVAALLRDGRLAVVEDASVETPPPHVWAQAVAAAAARWGADRIVAESNMGGEMVAATLRQADCALPVVWDFRTADVASGGEGAPLVPFFHFACARWFAAPGPVAFLNLGGGRRR